MNKILAVTLVLLGSLNLYVATKDGEMKNTKLKITVGGSVVTATMYDNPNVSGPVEATIEVSE